MRAKVTAFINDLIIYDYVLFGSAFFLFLLFVILGLIFRKKMGLAIFLIVLGFSTLILLPTLGYTIMHTYLFKNTTTLVSEKKLEYTKAVVVKGTLLNESNVDFKECKITANVHKASNNKYRNYLFSFKTMKKMSILRKDIAKGSQIDFKIIVEPFHYSKKYSISLGADCK